MRRSRTCQSLAPMVPSIVSRTRTMQRYVLNWMLGPRNILTIVSADVDEGRAQHLRSEFENLLAGGLPDGLLETRLLGDGQGHWAIHSLWRDRAALDAMRASAEPPAAPALFRRFAAHGPSVGATCPNGSAHVPRLTTLRHPRASGRCPVRSAARGPVPGTQPGIDQSAHAEACRTLALCEP